MNKNQNTETHSATRSETKSFRRFLQHLLAVKGILSFDIFQYSNTYNEKLPIIYANIRVWILD